MRAPLEECSAGTPAPGSALAGLRVTWLALAFVLGWAVLAHAQQESQAAPDWAYDPETAQEIQETCAGCHGQNADGSRDGEYPRLAGLDEAYIARQLDAFKTHKRINIPMYPYATERELPESDVRDIARLLSMITLPTETPTLGPELSALERLRAVQSVFNIPRVEGDVERGAEIYENECQECHGEDGWGDDDTPQLAGQHTSYLRRQVESLRSGARINEDMDGVFDGLDDEDLEDVYAYLASRDD